MKTILAQTIFFCSATLFAAHAATIPFSPPKVIAAMGRVDARLKIIVAHRGIYGHLCPENSQCGIDAAVNSGIEAVEIDVKESADGTPWPSHDLTVGRGTTYTRNGVFFDPYHHYASNDANNPTIANLHDGQLRALALRDIDGRVVSAYKNISLEDLLNDSRIFHKNIVYVFDIKYPQDVDKVAGIVSKLGLASASVLKFSATFFQPLEVYRHTKGIAFAPTLYAQQLDQIAAGYFTDRPYNDRVYSYMHAFSVVKGFTYYEIGNKMFVKSGSSVGVAGPLADISNRLAADRLPLSNFVPVTEHVADSRSPQTGFYGSDGYCCTRLIDFLSRTAHFGNETRDDRPDLTAQVRYNENVITDNATEARDTAERLGSRQGLGAIVN